VLMSGYFEEASRTNAGERGWHFLQKPFDMAELTRHLRIALQDAPGVVASQANAQCEVREGARG